MPIRTLVIARLVLAAIFAANLAGGLAGAATAQPKPGDLVVSAAEGILVIDHRTRRLSTLAAGVFGDVRMGADNNSILTIKRGNPSALIRIAPSGAQTTLSPAGAVFDPGPLLQDQDGSFIVAAGRSLLRLSSAGVTTLAANLIAPVIDLCRDGDTGDVIAALDQIPYLTYIVRRDAVTGKVSPLVTMTRGYEIAHDQRTGNFLFGSSFFVLFLDRDDGHIVSTLAPLPIDVGDIVVDQPTSLIWVAGGKNCVRAVVLVTNTGVVVGTWAYPVPSITRGFQSVQMWGSRKLSGIGTGDRNSTYALRVNLPLSPGALYCCALSFAGMRPGLRFATTTAHIAPDGLFHATVCGRMPGLTTGFAGRLDANGSASARFVIPGSVPVGTVYTAAAVAVNPGLPGSVDVTESIPVVVTR